MYDQQRGGSRHRKKGFPRKKMYVCASMCPMALKGNEAEGCIEAALSSARDLISPPSPSLPSITSSSSSLPVILTTAGEMLAAVMTKRRREERGNGGKMRARKRTHVTYRIITTGRRVHVSLDITLIWKCICCG